MGRVLLVNDSKFESVVMKDVLGSLGYNVKISDEYNAMNEAQSFQPDYIIVNYVMKEIFGDQLISLVKLKVPETKCVLFSSNPIKQDGFRYKKIDAVFQTPIDRGKIEQIFRKIG